MNRIDLNRGADFSPRMRQISDPRGLKPKSTDKDLKNAVSTNNHWNFRRFRLAPVE